MAILEKRLRSLHLLQTEPPEMFFVQQEVADNMNIPGAQTPFMERGIPSLHIQPSPLPTNQQALDVPTIHDWGKIVTGFALEWLDMMEVWPE